MRKRTLLAYVEFGYSIKPLSFRIPFSGRQKLCIRVNSENYFINSRNLILIKKLNFNNEINRFLELFKKIFNTFQILKTQLFHLNINIINIYYENISLNMNLNKSLISLTIIKNSFGLTNTIRIQNVFLFINKLKNNFINQSLF
ncbi:hypothetical protein BpHYR1_015783 [Brachionus plicatilis]|uniref:Uncharacterized protein n=1 Tax=Brachionus plicatilis TaxID=10195 RepID=A0A3M7T428_BRAPC|nr:hypothetical protein BpHYR1_015783 [Brachionus plicatilis]